jgi:hypothetical protein
MKAICFLKCLNPPPGPQHDVTSYSMTVHYHECERHDGHCCRTFKGTVFYMSQIAGYMHEYKNLCVIFLLQVLSVIHSFKIGCFISELNLFSSEHLEATQSSVQRVLGSLSPRVQWPGREADHSSSFHRISL